MFVVGAFFANRIKEIIHSLSECELDLDVADLALAITGFEIVDLRGVRVEGVVVFENRVAFDPARNVGPNSVWVSEHASDFFCDRVGVVRQHDRVAPGFAHLALSVGS